MGGIANAVGSIISSNNTSNATEAAANTQAESTEAQIREIRRQYDQNREDQMPWLEAGQNALSDYQTLLSGDYSSFKESPDYQFALSQGLNSVQGSAAAAGGLYSGNALRSINDYAQGVASQNYNTYANRLASLAGLGQTSAISLGNAGQQTGSSVANALQTAADSQSSSILTNAAYQNQALQNWQNQNSNSFWNMYGNTNSFSNWNMYG